MSHTYKMTTIECAICGAAKSVRLSDVRRGWGRYCSRRCTNIFRNRLRAKIPQGGELNPNWKGGVSQDKSRYKDRFRAKYPEKATAHDAVARAVEAGRLVRQPCEVCGAVDDVHAHHDDYGRPLDVRWLCRAHQRAHHATPA